MVMLSKEPAVEQSEPAVLSEGEKAVPPVPKPSREYLEAEVTRQREQIKDLEDRLERKSREYDKASSDVAWQSALIDQQKAVLEQLDAELSVAREQACSLLRNHINTVAFNQLQTKKIESLMQNNTGQQK